MANTEDEKILKSLNSDNITSLEKNDYNIISNFGKLNEDELFNFQLAYKVVCGTSDVLTVNIHKDQINDLFLALGFTIPDDDISRLLNNMVAESDGEYSFEVILEAFTKWKIDLLRIDDLAHAFKMIQTKKHIFPIMPKEDLHIRNDIIGVDSIENLRTLRMDAKLTNRVFRNILKDILNTEGGDVNIKDNDVNGIIDEISSDLHSSISFADFLRIFQYASSL